MADYIWLVHKEKKTEWAWAIAGSALTHAALFGALTFAEANYPVAGDNGLKIVWLSLSASLPDPGTPSQPDEAHASETSAIARVTVAQSGSASRAALLEKPQTQPVYAPETKQAPLVVAPHQQNTFGPQESPRVSSKVLAKTPAHPQMPANDSLLSAIPSEPLPTESASPNILEAKQWGNLDATSNAISVAPQEHVELEVQSNAVDMRQRHVIVPEIQQQTSKVDQRTSESRKEFLSSKGAAGPKPRGKLDSPISQAYIGASRVSRGDDADHASKPHISAEKKIGANLVTTAVKDHLPKTASAARHEKVPTASVQLRHNLTPEVQEQGRKTDQTTIFSRKSEVASTGPSVNLDEDRGPNPTPHLQMPSKPALSGPYTTARSGDSDLASKRTVITKEKGESVSLFKSTAENAKGVVPSIKGDLRMTISGNTRAKLQVFFRAYPKVRRAKAQTRAEALQRKIVVPVMLRPSADVVEAVIETAEEGIYVFSITPDGAGIATGAFTFRIFEGGTRERMVKLGSRRIGEETILVKILMPEAAIWDDNAAFTGSIEDSESTTKFNTATGLSWKEYN